MTITRGALFELGESLKYISAVRAPDGGRTRHFVITSEIVYLKDFDTGQLQQDEFPSFFKHEVAIYALNADRAINTNPTIDELIGSKFVIDKDFLEIKRLDVAEKDVLEKHADLVKSVRERSSEYLNRIPREIRN